MKKIILITSCIVAICMVLQNCKKKDDLKNVDCSTVAATYNSDIKLLMTSQCTSGGGCHGTGSSRGDYTSYAGLKAAADNGSLESKTITNKSMPPSGALSLDDRKKIKCWLNNGSPNN
jgi:hypothetical protein